uniref:Uncharacterized protein n=1 Tax=Angiostrongylus cantonensis TaxID=6313 RepID=A0A0K0DKV2_ANGCA
MDINTEIPAPSKPEESLADIGYDVPRDTISREFIRSAKTARQLHSQHPRDEGLRYLMPSPSSSSSKLACESPRIIISKAERKDVGKKCEQLFFICGLEQEVNVKGAV